MNVEVAVIQFLKSQTNWTVAGEVPADNPAKFITVERTGGAREAMVLDMAEVMISVYHKTSKLECANQTDEIADVIPGLLEDYADINTFRFTKKSAAVVEEYKKAKEEAIRVKAAEPEEPAEPEDKLAAILESDRDVIEDLKDDI